MNSTALLYTGNAFGLKSVALVFSLLLAASSTFAAEPRCEVLTVHASNDGKGIDDGLAQYAAVFKKGPFSKYSSFKLVESDIVKIKLVDPVRLRLPDEIEGTVELNKVVDGRFDLTLVFSRPQKEPIRINGVAAPDSPIFAAGMKSSVEGVWIFGIVCNGQSGGIAY